MEARAKKEEEDEDEALQVTNADLLTTIQKHLQQGETVIRGLRRLGDASKGKKKGKKKWGQGKSKSKGKANDR